MLAVFQTAFMTKPISLLVDFCERRPRTAWLLSLALVLLLVGIESGYWVVHDYPGAMWHNTPRGDDIEIAMDRAAVAGPRELAGFWTGQMLVGNGYYRPLSSCLFVLQYHLFGEEDRRWQAVSVASHLGVALALVGLASVLLEGPLFRRLTIGTLAAVLMGGPGFADRSVQQWILGWWPCQPDLWSLLAAFGLFAAVTRYARDHRKGDAALALFLFALGVSFKEMAFVAGLGACLLLVRHRRAWPLLALLAVEGVVLFVFRHWALRGQSNSVDAPTIERVFLALSPVVGPVPTDPILFVLHFLPVGAAALLFFSLRKKLGAAPAGTAALAAYLGVSFVLSGGPLEPAFLAQVQQHGRLALRGALLAGLLLAARRWPVPELIVLTLCSVVLVAGVNPVFGHYRYWASVFGSLLAAVALVTLAEHLWRRRLPAPAT